MKFVFFLFCFPIFLKAIEVPKLTGPLVDEIGFFSAGDRAQIEAELVQFKQKNNVQLSVLVPASLQETDIESYSMEVAEKWKLGKKGEDRGLILILAPKERQMRLEVGYGLEGDIPDAISKRMLAEILKPALRAGRAKDGVIALIHYAEARLQKTEGNIPEEIEPRRAKPRLSFLLFILLVVIVLFIKSFLFPRYPGGGMHGGGWGGGGYGGGGFGGFGGSGGGGWSGGGGGFGGGGASDRW